MNERPTSHHSEACIHCTKERKRLSLLPTSASHRSSNWWNRSKRNELKAAYRRAFFPIDFFKSIKSCLVFFFRYLCCTANIPFVFMLQWRKEDEDESGKHHARVRGGWPELHLTLRYLLGGSFRFRYHGLRVVCAHLWL